MASLTVRNLPDDAKQRFRQIAAAHGRSMEEHLRQLVIDAEFEQSTGLGVREMKQEFRHQRSGEEIVRDLIRVADGAGHSASETGKYAEIRFMTAKEAMAELRRLANGAELPLAPRMNTKLEAPSF